MQKLVVVILRNMIAYPKKVASDIFKRALEHGAENPKASRQRLPALSAG
jgi:hypothetical protein